jgi:hypothetical protein
MLFSTGTLCIPSVPPAGIASATIIARPSRQRTTGSGAAARDRVRLWLTALAHRPLPLAGPHLLAQRLVKDLQPLIVLLLEHQRSATSLQFRVPFLDRPTLRSKLLLPLTGLPALHNLQCRILPPR